MNIHKQISLITLVVSLLSSALALGMDSELVVPVATKQLPTPGVYQIESARGPELIYVDEEILRAMGPEVFRGLKRIGDLVEPSQESMVTQNSADPKALLEICVWLKKHYPSKFMIL